MVFTAITVSNFHVLSRGERQWKVPCNLLASSVLSSPSCCGWGQVVAKFSEWRRARTQKRSESWSSKQMQAEQMCWAVVLHFVVFVFFSMSDGQTSGNCRVTYISYPIFLSVL